MKDLVSIQDLQGLEELDKDFFSSWINLGEETYRRIVNPIQDLINLFEKLEISDYAIAGGYVRDQFAKNVFSDVDVFIPGMASIMDERKFKELEKHFKFFSRQSDFIDAYMIDRVNFNTLKYPVQFIGWNRSFSVALNAFDFQHCKFVLFPKLKLVLADEGALESIESNTLLLSFRSTEFLKSLKYNFTLDHIVNLESLIYRTSKFVSRGMLPPNFLPFEESLTLLETKFYDTRYGHRPDLQVYSKLLGGAVAGSETMEVRNMESTPLFPFEEVMQNLCAMYLKWIAPANNLSMYLVSPSSNLRQATKAFLETKK